MDRLLSLELHNMLQNVPLSTFDESLLKDRITEEIPTIAKECGISHLLVRSTVPARSFKDVAHTSESILFSDGSEIDELLEHRIDHGDGGFTLFLYQYSDKPEDISVAEDNLRDLFSVIYILIGRARSMSFMTHALYTDGMTGISNETGIHKFIGEAHRAGRFTQYNAYFINIKDMQMINEQYGSRMGDEVIKAYALKLREVAGKDAIAGRLGGDNFFIFSHRSNHNDIVYKLEAIKLSVPNPNGKDLDVTMECRTGYSEMTEETEVSEAMTEAAVAKMFAGKNGKPNILRFSNDLINLIRQKRMLQASIPVALKNREFEVYYQPKAVYTEDGTYRLCGAEALVRWMRDGRLVMPSEFIPILEEMGMILDIDFYVFEVVCENIKRWINSGYKPVRISSNFSQRHLQNEDFADQILDVIRKHNIAPEFIEIEITESYDIHNLQKMTRFAQRMHENGIRLSVDDFGSGYASFSMIKNISADTIKLDKNLIDGVAGGSVQDEIIVRNIIRMVEELGKDIIAEGVEYEHQATFLRECGCNMIQGFIYGRPMPEQLFLDDYLSHK